MRESPPHVTPKSPAPGHFDSVAADYARHRPIYPEALIEWLVGNSRGRGLGWDCGTGNGQVARSLAAHMKQVLATDISAAQLAQAPPLAGVTFRHARAENSGFEPGSVDLVVVAQALHWFDVDAFNHEANRVLRPGGLMAQWCYGLMRTGVAPIDAEVTAFYEHIVGPYWPAERRHVENGYRDLPFPFQRIPAKAFSMTAEWTLPDLLGYLRSWSATARHTQMTGVDPVSDLTDRLVRLWGDSERTRHVEWPLTLRVGRTSCS